MADALILSPVRFGATAYVLRVEVDGVGSNVLVSVSKSRDYWMSGDGQADGSGGNGDLLMLLRSRLATVAPGVSVTRTGGQRIEASVPSGTIALLWGHGNTTLDGLVFGFDGDTATAATVVSPNQPQGIFRPEVPTGFGRDMPTVIAGLDRSVAGDVAGTFFGEGYKERKLRLSPLSDHKVRSAAALATEAFGTLDRLWTETFTKARRWRLYEDETALEYSVYRCISISEPYSQHPRHPLYWQAMIEAVRLATWVPTDSLAAPWSDWAASYSANDITGIGPYTWDVEAGAGPQLTHDVAFSQGELTAPLSPVGIAPHRVDGAFQPGTEGFRAAGLSSFPAGAAHIRCLFKAESEVSGRTLFAYVASVNEYVRVTMSSTTAGVVTWRNATMTYVQGIVLSNNGWHLLDVVVDPTGGGVGGASMGLFLNGADISPADHPTAGVIPTTGQLGLGSWIDGTLPTSGALSWWGVRPGTGIDLATHQAHAVAIGV